MGTDDDLKKEFKKLHAVGIKGLLFHYGGVKGLLTSKPLWLAIILTVFLSMLYGQKTEKLSNSDVLKILEDLLDTGISVDGGLIGLTLAGLTLVVTFGSETFMKTIVRKAVKKSLEKRSFQQSEYQTIIAKFGFAVLIQVVTLVFYILVRIIKSLNFQSTENIAFITNQIVLMLLVFLLMYALLLVIQMTVNIFSIGQIHHMLFFDSEAKQEAK